MEFDCERIENSVGKEENSGYKHYILFQHCFKKPFLLGSVKIRIMQSHSNKLEASFLKVFNPLLHNTAFWSTKNI